MQIGPMMNSAQVYSTALYNNGSVPFKDARFAENYGPNGDPQIIRTEPKPTDADLRRGVLAALWPLPRFEITQPGTIFRPFERGGGPKSELGNPNRDDVPGQPDVTVSNRGFGTQGSIDPVFLGAQKTRLNDPVLAFLDREVDRRAVRARPLLHDPSTLVASALTTNDCGLAPARNADRGVLLLTAQPVRLRRRSWRSTPLARREPPIAHGQGTCSWTR